MHDVPDRLGWVLYIVGQHGSSPKWAILECPCRCGERIYVTLMKSRDPHWELPLSGEDLTLWPSLWVSQCGCGSHFWVKRSIIEWVN
jgi:hypothetical protein